MFYFIAFIVGVIIGTVGASALIEYYDTYCELCDDAWDEEREDMKGMW